MKINKILIALFLVILTVGAVSASDNATDADTPHIEDKNITSPSAEKLNADYYITVDEEYLAGSDYESEFNIDLYEREFMDGKLEILIDDEVKYCANQALEYYNSYPVLDSYTVLDSHFLDTLKLSFGPHKAEFKYSGDQFFNAFDEIRYFNYTYLKFDLPDEEIDFGRSCRITAQSTDATGKLKIVVDNRTVHDRKITGYEDCYLGDLAIGTHTYDIYYTGSGNYKSVHRHGTVKVNYEFRAYFTYDSDEKPTITDEYILRVVLPHDAASKVRIDVNNKTYSSSLKSGQCKIKITNLKIGENVVYITYGDENYPERTITEKITVIPDLDFSYFETGYQQFDAKVRLTVCEGANGTLKVKVDDKTIACSLVNGTAAIALDTVKPGLHNFAVSYTGDYEEYVQNRTYENIYIQKKDLIDIWDDRITLELPKGESGTLTVKINDKTETVNIENTTGYTYPLKLNEGIWNIRATFKGKNITETQSCRIDTEKKYFTLHCKDYYMKDDGPKNVILFYDKDSVLKGITAYIDNRKVKVSQDGVISLSKLSAGAHTLKVEYRNAKNVLLQSEKKKITIADHSNPIFELKDKDSVALNGNTINPPIKDRIILTDNMTLVMDMNLKGNVRGTVTVYKTFTYYVDGNSEDYNEIVIGKYKSFNLNKGKARISIPTNMLNELYGLKFTVNLDDGNEIDVSLSTLFASRTVHPAKMHYGENRILAIYVNVPDNTTIGMFGPFKPLYSTIINGKAEFSLSTLPIRNGMPVTFAYAKEKNGKPDLQMEGYELKLNVLDSTQKIDMTYSDGTVYSLKVSEIYGKTVKPGESVKFKIGKQSIAVKINRKGIANLKIPNSIKPGTYTLTAAYKDGKIVKKLTIRHVVSLKAVKVKKYAKKLVLTATLKKVNGKYLKGKKITFTFNGKKYAAKTNAKGVAKVTIKKAVLNKLKVGKKITYTATYAKDTVKRTAKVSR